MGISKVEELANCDIQRLTERFGKMGLRLKQAAHGLDFSEIEESGEAIKSIIWSSTFKENTNDPIKIAGYLEMLAESVHKSLFKHRLYFLRSPAPLLPKNSVIFGGWKC
ncbi:DNA polymerase Y family protein [Methanosarcina acetivorans]|uniref:Uncharacterized protein n=1 Tax=Methanosarcina acetivorans (strain ATCC 35395 / DSM 2834 / JCM 12185 / C2A) TaxID=188937 RepID=Q8TS33_METAC|nr:hypothetical protein [Methanosarcina acetivorans]AAM04406.1 predicted protein [Methanosarcina acetivorans C2A]